MCLSVRLGASLWRNSLIPFTLRFQHLFYHIAHSTATAGFWGYVLAYGPYFINSVGGAGG